MTKAEILKAEILKQYKSVRQFALEMGIPYSTLVTALDRGIEGMAYGTVIRMCDKESHWERGFLKTELCSIMCF